VKLKKLDWKIPAGLLKTVYTIPAWQKAAIWVASWVVPIILFWFLFLSPRMGEMNTLSGQIPNLRQQVQKLEAKEEQIPKLKEELKIMEQILEDALKLLPESKDIPSVLTGISSLGNESRLEFLSFKPQREQIQNFYAAIPVDIEVTGSFHNTVSFFDKVGRMARIVHIKEIQMGNAQQHEEVWSQKGTAPAGETAQAAGTGSADGVAEDGSASGETVWRGSNWIINTRCQATTYRFLSQEELEAAKQQDGKNRR
jgi:type IV pilus assembly protein PilO